MVVNLKLVEVQRDVLFYSRRIDCVLKWFTNHIFYKSLNFTENYY